MFDILSNVANKKIDCLDKGFVEIIDVMPRLGKGDEKTADFAVAEAARNSFADATKRSDDRTLIRYMMRHNHGTPFEVITFQFNVKLPIFLARQWMRHRVCSYNELSGRYSEMKDEFFSPDKFRKQSNLNKQGGSEEFDGHDNLRFYVSADEENKSIYQVYKWFLSRGMVKEQARVVLPLSTYTNFYWTVNLRSLMNFIGQRSDSHAQKEIQCYSNAILDLIRPIIPVCIEAFEDYSPMRGAMIITALEIEAIKKMMGTCVTGITAPDISSTNKREQDEWKEKAHRLGIC